MFYSLSKQILKFKTVFKDKIDNSCINLIFKDDDSHQFKILSYRQNDVISVCQNGIILVHLQFR